MDTSAGFKVVFEILFNFYFPSMLVLCLQLQSESEMIRSFEVLWCEETKQSHSCSHQSQPQSQLPNDPVRDFSSPPPRQLHSSPSESCPHLLLLSRLLPPRSPPPPSSPSPPLRCPCSARRGESGGRTLNQDFQNCTTNVSCIHINLWTRKIANREQMQIWPFTLPYCLDCLISMCLHHLVLSRYLHQPK